MAQTHKGERSDTGGVHVAIEDFGPGFRATLAELSPANECAAIEKAFEEGVSGTGNRLRGYGLPGTLEYVNRYPGARLSIMSRTGQIERVEGSFQLSHELPDCGGVLVSLSFPY